MEKKTLIIGAAGDVCIEVLKMLAADGVDLKVAARNPDKARQMNLPKVEIVKFDYYHPETFSNVVSNVDKILLVSPPSHLKLQQHVKMVIDQARIEGVTQIVNISAFGIQNDTHPMRIIETYIENSGLAFSFLRPNCYMQYFNTYFKHSIVAEGLIRMPVGEARTSFVDMRDVAEAAKLLLEKESQDNTTYTLTGPEALNLFQIAEMISEITNREIKYQQISELEYKTLLKLDGWFDTSIEASLKLCQFVKQGWNSVITSGLPLLLQRKPTTFRQYIIDYAEVWKEPVGVI